MVSLNTRSTSPGTGGDCDPQIIFEIFVQNKFSDLEVSSVVSTLSMANQILDRERFQWKFVSDMPGLVESRCGLIVRAEPAVFEHNLRHFLIVVGGNHVKAEAWMPRVRAMQRKKRLVVILSDSATAFIKTFRDTNQSMTTHWQDIRVLEESGYYPNLSGNYAEVSGDVVTSAGTNYTVELIVRLIAKYLSPNEYAEIGSRLIVQSIRDIHTKQPKGTSYLMNAFGPQISCAIQIMEENLADPISTREISKKVGLSVRQLERLFTKHLGVSPGRYFKKIRINKAHALVTETNMALIDIALATGFSSASSLTSAYRSVFGKSPSMARSGQEHL